MSTSCRENSLKFQDSREMFPTLTVVSVRYFLGIFVHCDFVMSGIDEPSTSSGQPARNMPKIDYKKFSEGNFAEVAFSDTQSDENAANQYEDADDVLPLGDPDEEIERMQREVVLLEEETKILQKSQAVREMRQKLTEKRKEVQRLSGIQLTTPTEEFKHNLNAKRNVNKSIRHWSVFVTMIVKVVK